MAVSEYDKKHLTQEQQNEIQRVTEEAKKTGNWDAAHKRAEEIRNSAGYSGGRYGDQHDSNPRPVPSRPSTGYRPGSQQKAPSGQVQFKPDIVGKPEQSNNRWGSYSGSEIKEGPGYVTGGWTQAADGSIWLDDNPYWNKQFGGDTDRSRRPDLAGKVANHNGKTIFFDELGYAHEARNGETGYRPHQDHYVQNGIKGQGLWTDQEMLTPEDRKRIEQIRAEMQAGHITSDQANQMANDIRKGYGYTADKGGWITDLGAAGTAHSRGEQWGVGNGPSSAESGFINQIYPPNWNFGQNRPSGGNRPQMNSNSGFRPGGSASGGGSTSTVTPGGGYTPSSGEEYLRQLYEQRRKAEEARIRSAWEASLNKLQENGGLIGKEYADKRNQVAAQNDLQRMQMAELAAAQGLNTGATGQMALGQSSAYQGAMGNLFDQEAADQTALNNAIARAQQQYLSQLTSSQAGIDAELNDALYREFVRQQEAAEAARRQAIEDQRWQMQWDAQQQQQQWENQFAQDQWNAKQQAMMAESAPAAQTGGHRVGNGGGNILDEYVDTGRGYDNGGLSREQIIQLQNAIGVTPDGMWGSNSSSTAGDLAGSRGDGSPLTAKEAWQLWGGGVQDFGNLTRTLQGLMATGQKDAADAFMRKYWDQLNLSQANEWDTMVSRFYGK